MVRGTRYVLKQLVVSLGPFPEKTQQDVYFKSMDEKHLKLHFRHDRKYLECSV